jgi:hypothetical protein
MTQPFSAAQEAQAQQLAQRLSQAVADDLLQMARTLVATAPESLFGATEFSLRDQAHRLAAKALQLHLQEKKTATRGPV